MSAPNPPSNYPSGKSNQPKAGSAQGGFPTTHWGTVRSAAEDGSPGGMASMDLMLRRYRPTVLRYLIARFGIEPDQAEDLWQGFVMSRILKSAFLARASPKQGRFRNLMLVTLDNYVIDEMRRERARKRSPSVKLVNLDALREEETPSELPSTEDESELVWARAVLAGALLNMRLECAQQGHGDVWTVFYERVLRPILDDTEPLDYSALVHLCQFESATKACNALTTAKRMFKRHLGKVIDEYAGGDSEAAEELRAMQKRLEGRA